MASIIGSLIGILTSMLPRIFDLFQGRADARHELALMQLQLEHRKLLGDIALEQEDIQLERAAREADMEEHKAALAHDSQAVQKASKWVANYAAMVRPNIAYLLVAEVVMLTIFAGTGKLSPEWYAAIWNDGTQGLFSTIIMFYFGNRTFNRKRQT